MSPAASKNIRAGIALMAMIGAVSVFAQSNQQNQQNQQGPVPTASPSESPSPSPSVSPSPSASPSESPSPSPSVAAVTVMTSSSGQFLVDSQGRSLYLFQADTPNSGQSTCNAGGCSTAWPPFTAQSGQTVEGSGTVQSGMLGTITRSDGSTQVTYFGWPLYYYSGDTAAGQTNGEGLNQFGALWYLVQPDGTALTSVTATASPSPSPSPSESPSPSASPTGLSG